MAQARSIVHRIHLAPAIALMFGVAVATLVAATPQWMFEGTVGASGFGRLLSVAQPPLGIKARMLAILVAFTLVTLVVWFAVRAVERLIEGPLGDRNDDADVELDLAAYAATLPKLNVSRGPIFADRELGAPLMSDAALVTAASSPTTAEPVFTSLPVNFAPEPLLPPEPLSPPEPIDEWAQPDDFAEPVVETVAELPALSVVDGVDDHALALAEPLSLDEFDLPPAPVDEPEQLSGETSIEALIRRLEAGMARRRGVPPPGPTTTAINAAPAPASRDWVVRKTDPDESLDDGAPVPPSALRRLIA